MIRSGRTLHTSHPEQRAKKERSGWENTTNQRHTALVASGSFFQCAYHGAITLRADSSGHKVCKHQTRAATASSPTPIKFHAQNQSSIP